MGLLPDTLNCGSRMHRECRERFPLHRGLAIPISITARALRVSWCMPGSLTNAFLWSRWRGKRSRHSRRMRIPQYFASGKRPMASYRYIIQYVANDMHTVLFGFVWFTGLLLFPISQVWWIFFSDLVTSMYDKSSLIPTGAYPSLVGSLINKTNTIFWLR